MTAAAPRDEAPAGATDDSRQLVFRERIEALYRPRIESVASGLVVGAVLALALLRVHPWPLVLAWYLGICFVQSGRGALFRPSRYRPVQVNDPTRWGRRYLVDVMVAGLYWGVSLAALARPDDLLTQSCIAMAMGGMAVGSITVHAYHRPVMYAFLACLLLPFAVRVVLIGDFAHLYLGLGLVLLGIYLALYGRFHARTLERSITLRHENRSLIAQLRMEREAALLLQATAEAASQSKSRFFAGASHDLRQPLQALSLYASVLSDSRLPDDLHQVSLRVGESVHVLEELFDGVLDIAHIEAGRMEIRREPVQVRQLMERALLLFGGEALDKGLSIKCVPCSAWVAGDSRALQRIVSNLVANAVRHTREGRVLLGARRRGAVLRLLVLDTGPGIEPAAHTRIFEEFYRLPSAGGNGFGLGLATVKRLCDLAGYQLGFASQPGAGSAFWVELPLVNAPAPCPLGPATATRAQATASLNVLLVEDDAAARGGLETILRTWGHVCVSAESAEQAVTLMATQPHRWDVVVSDFNLPGGRNGLQVIETVRSASRSDLVAVLISGTMEPALRDQAIRAACIPLAKPVRPLQLRSVMDQIAAQAAGTPRSAG
ncbi:MAG: hybrid sensor histidine kinase/response regulator [Burkholderiaceae bacterium]|nr:hybrid sensor histidine kinase/response regulator [Burkholderiaceae bacterium]